MQNITTLVLLGLVLCIGGCGDHDAVTRDPGGVRPGALASEDIALNNRGVALMGQFDYLAARDVFRQVVDRQPGWLDARINLAIATLNRQTEGDEDRALALALEVLASDPGHLRAHYVSGLLELYRGAVEVAATHFSAVLDGDPDDAFAAYYLAQCKSHEDLDGALALYERAIAKDPYLRSAYYGAAQTLRRLGRMDEAKASLATYSRFANNPRAQLAEFKYTRMGPRGDAVAIGLPSAARVTIATGPLFASSSVIARLGHKVSAASLTTVDLQNDGIQDLYVAGDGYAALFVGAEDEFQPRLDHPLAAVTDVRAAAWGDFDNDGLTDVYLCRDGANQLWQQTVEGEWRDLTAAAGVAGGEERCADAMFVDADHDGDLDIFYANESGGAELLSNNLDGTFRALGGSDGLNFGDAPARQVLATDLDNDRDVDLVLVRQTPPHAVFLNDRLWRYQSAGDMAGLIDTPMRALVAADVDADGLIELYGAAASGQLARWRSDAAGHWRSQVIGSATGPAVQLVIAEFDGDGRPDLLVRDDDGLRVLALSDAGPTTALLNESGRFAAALVLLDDARSGPSLVAIVNGEAGAELHHWPAGEGRGRFAAFRFSGKDEQAESMRSNRSGIGTRVAVRTGSHWSMADTFDSDSGGGQSLQPLAIGLGNRETLDYVAVNWSDGVFQTELDLSASDLHRISETQRQLSSCPVIFAWDGEEFRFVSDVLGVGGLGFLLGPGRYSTPRPWEYFLLPEGLPSSRDGMLPIKFTEPMEEIAYLDQARLYVYDLAPGWQMVMDERMATGAPAVTGEALFYRRDAQPVEAHNGHGEDVLARLLRADGFAVEPGPVDRRFIGRTIGAHSVTLKFDRPLDASAGRPVLLADGWVEYPYSQTVFAAWQAGAGYDAPTLEAATADGRWQTVRRAFGYPAGMPRTMALPLDDLPAGTIALRLTSSLQLYWDRIAVAWAEEPGDNVRVREAPLTLALVAQPGFPLRLTRPQRRPDYDYSRRTPFWDSRYPAGFYTELGDALALVADLDDAFAIIGPGEEVHLEFAAPAAATAGWARRHVLETRGFAKDMDLYTRDGGTVAPLPRAGVTGARREALHSRYNTRFQAGH